MVYFIFTSIADCMQLQGMRKLVKIPNRIKQFPLNTPIIKQMTFIASSDGKYN